jgi:hypothetical protein
VAAAVPNFYSADIDNTPRKTGTMNTSTTLQRFGSFTLAVALTLGMLMGVQSLATSDPTPAQLARAAAAASAAS